MAHPSYPSRALGREWRVAYKRATRRLVVVFALALCCAVVGCWLAISWASGHMLDGAPIPASDVGGMHTRVHSVYSPR